MSNLAFTDEEITSYTPETIGTQRRSRQKASLVAFTELLYTGSVTSDPAEMSP